MKPKLFLCAGMSKSGTTTLWKLLNNYNLINNMRYKETHYLKMLCDMRDGNTDDIYPQDIKDCLLYTSPSPRDRTRSRMPSSA